MTRQILALLILVALIAGIFRAIQQNAINTSADILSSQTTSLVTSVPPTSTFAPLQPATAGDQDQSVASTASTATSISNRPATPTTRTLSAGGGQGSRPSQFPDTGFLDETEALATPVALLLVVVSGIVVVTYIGGRRR